MRAEELWGKQTLAYTCSFSKDRTKCQPVMNQSFNKGVVSEGMLGGT